MSVSIEYSVDRLGWTVVRTRNRQYGKMEVLTDKGWIIRDITKPFKVDPSMMWESDDLQDLVEALAKKGVKAQTSGFAEGKLAGVESHLEDMRRLVFDEVIKETYQIHQPKIGD
jgi:uncharacterized protein YfaT (DUF1175 family)